MSDWENVNSPETYSLLTEARDYFLVKGVIKRSMDLLRLGQREKYYIDFDIVTNEPHRCETVTKLYMDKIEKISMHRHPAWLGFIEKYSGGSIGAIRLSGYISSLIRIPNFPIRLTKLIEDEQIKAGPFLDEHKNAPGKKLRNSRVAIMTDHMTTGGEVLTAIDVVEDNGGKVSDVIAYTVFRDRLDEQFKRREIRVNNIFNIPHDFPLEVWDTIMPKIYPDT